MKTNDDERGIMKTMFFPGYHHCDFASTQALGHSCTWWTLTHWASSLCIGTCWKRYIYIYMYIYIYVYIYIYIYTYIVNIILSKLSKNYNYYNFVTLGFTPYIYASWTHGLIAQSVRASKRNSVVVGSNSTQANVLYLLQRILQ